MRAGHDRRGRRNGKSRLVAEALSTIDAPGRPRPLPPLRRRNHVLAGCRGDQAARRRFPTRPRRRRADPHPARRERRDNDAPRRSPGRFASCSRSRLRSSPCSTTSSGPRTRSSISSKGSDCSRPAPRSCSSASPGPELLDRRAQWPVTLRLEPLRGGCRSASSSTARPSSSARGSRPASGGNPLFVTGDGRDGSRRDRRRGSSADAESTARRAARPARPSRARRARAGIGRGRALPPGCGPGAGAGRAAGDAAARVARPPRADPPRPRAAPGRGRLPIPTPVDPRRGLRRPAEDPRVRSYTSASRTGWTTTEPTSSSSTRSWAITSSRQPRT